MLVFSLGLWQRWAGSRARRRRPGSTAHGGARGLWAVEVWGGGAARIADGRRWGLAGGRRREAGEEGLRDADGQGGAARQAGEGGAVVWSMGIGGW